MPSDEHWLTRCNDALGAAILAVPRGLWGAVLWSRRRPRVAFGTAAALAFAACLFGGAVVAARVMDAWAADALARQVADMPPGDFAAFRGLSARNEHVTRAPDTAGRVRDAEADWARRTADAAKDESARAKAAAGIAALSRESKRPDVFRPALRQLLLASLADESERLRPAVLARRYEAAAREARKAADARRADAAALGLTDELTAFVDRYEYLADLARLAGRPPG